MAGRIEGKVALISGSASGIGEAVTRRFAAEGARLWINDINAARLDALVTELRNDGVEVQGTVGDVSDSAFVTSWVDAANDEVRPHRHPLQQRGHVAARPRSATRPTKTGASSSA